MTSVSDSKETRHWVPIHSAAWTPNEGPPCNHPYIAAVWYEGVQDPQSGPMKLIHLCKFISTYLIFIN